MRSILSALALAFALNQGAALAAEPAAGLSPQMAREYVRPHELIDIGGRKLNLFCMGGGPRTVLFDAGGSDWSVIWALVQPAVATRARACAYDRAGLGYSDPAFMPRTPVQVVEDMHALIAKAGLKTPLVLVGHSLGGFNVKLYAALYPQDVAGLVLVDPAEERAAERTRTMLQTRYGATFVAREELIDQSFATWLLDRYRRCAAAAAAPLDPASDGYRRCSDPVRPRLGPEIAAERLRIQVTPAYQTAQASEILNSIYGDTRGERTYAELFRPGAFGHIPMVVLTHGDFDAEDPLDVADHEAGVALHRETARLSARGKQRTVAGTSHNIEIDAPDAIIDAVGEVLGQLGAGGPTRPK